MMNSDLDEGAKKPILLPAYHALTDLLIQRAHKITCRVSQKKYPLLAGNRNETIRYHYSPSGQLNLSIFNLDSHNLHLFKNWPPNTGDTSLQSQNLQCTRNQRFRKRA